MPFSSRFSPRDASDLRLLPWLLCSARQISRILGTRYFNSPESASGEPFHGKLHDVWAMGVTLYFFLYGKCPFFAENVVDFLIVLETAKSDHFLPPLVT